MRTVINVEPLENYRLLLEFENGEKRIGNIKPLLSKPVFSFLNDIKLFNLVYIEYGAVAWKDNQGNEVDICPDKLYMDSISFTEWDSDYTKATPAERIKINNAENSGFIDENDIDWDNLNNI